jgi:hypothetical protein
VFTITCANCPRALLFPHKLSAVAGTRRSHAAPAGCLASWSPTQGTTACVSFWRAVYHPYIRRVITPTLAMCPLFRKGDRQPYFNHPVKTNHRLQAEAHYKLITSCWPCNTTASLSKACYKGHIKAITRCALRYEPITKLVNHYEYLCRNEARYEARNAAVHSAWERAPARFVCVHTSQRYLATPNTCDVRG